MLVGKIRTGGKAVSMTKINAVWGITADGCMLFEESQLKAYATRAEAVRKKAGLKRRFRNVDFRIVQVDYSGAKYD